MKRRAGWAALLGCVLCLAACKRFQAQMTAEAELRALPPARSCSALLPDFGAREQAGGANVIFLAPNGVMDIRNDGGGCWIRYRYRVGGKPVVPDMRISTPPDFGKVLVGGVDGELRIAYRPQTGYEGYDQFVVLLDTPEKWQIPVRVAVQR